MNDEPTQSEVHEDDDQPATKGFFRTELKSVETNLRTEIEGVDRRLINVEQDVRELKDDMKETKQDVRGLKDTVGRVLAIVKSIDENTRGIPAKVEQLTKAVFPHR